MTSLEISEKWFGKSIQNLKDRDELRDDIDKLVEQETGKFKREPTAHTKTTVKKPPVKRKKRTAKKI